MRYSRNVTRSLASIALASALLLAGSNAAFASGGNQIIPASGTFRTPTGGAATCPGVPADVDCQIDVLFGTVGGPDNGVNPGAEDRLTTQFIHEDVPAPGFWSYKDLEEISDVRGVFRGFERGVIDARPGLSSTGRFVGAYHGTTDDGCWVLDFGITGVIDLSGFVDQSGNPVNNDSGVWRGALQHKC